MKSTEEKIAKAIELEERNRVMSGELVKEKEKLDADCISFESVKSKHTIEKEEFIVWKNQSEKKIETDTNTLTAKQKFLEEKEKKCVRQERFLTDWAIRLKDKEHSLQKVAEEVRK